MEVKAVLRIAYSNKKELEQNKINNLKFGQRVMDVWRGQNLIQRVFILKLRLGIVNRMFMIFVCDFRKVMRFGSVFFHVFSTSVAKHLSCDWTGFDSHRIHHQLDVFVQWIGLEQI